MSTKTIVRLSVFATIGLVAAGGGATWLLSAKREHKAQAESDLDRCVQLVEEERYEEALELLQKVHTVLRDDVTVCRLFAKARLHVPLPGNVHVAQTVSALRKWDELAPRDPEIHRQLASLHKRTGAARLAVDSARKVANLSPDDGLAQLSLAEALIAHEDWEGAITATDRAIALIPDDFRCYEFRVRAMRDGLAATSRQVRRFVDQAIKNNADDQDFTSLRLLIARVNLDVEVVDAIVADVVAAPPQTAAHLRWVVHQLETLKYFSEAMTLLERDVARRTDPDVVHLLAYRLWQLGKYERLIGVTTRDSQHAASDEFLVLQSIAHLHLGQTDEVVEQLSKLAQRSSRLAEVWSPILEAATSDDDNNRIRLLEACDEGLNAYPHSSYLTYMRGMALEWLDEIDLAVADYQKIVARSPRCLPPRAALARLAGRSNEYHMAFLHAAEALAVNPEDAAMVEVLIRSAIQRIAAGETLSEDRLEVIRTGIGRVIENATDDIQASVGRASLALVEGRRNHLERELQSILTSGETVDSDLRPLLTTLARGTTLESKMVAQLEEGGQLTGGVLDEAVQIGMRDGVDAALASLRSKAPQSESLALSMAELHVLTQLDADAARQRALELAKEHTDNSQVLLMLQSSDALKNDRDSRLRLIERVKEIKGEGGMTWRLAHARWLMESDVDEKAIAEAAMLLKEVIEAAPQHPLAYELLAQCYDKIDNPNQSIRVLRSALEAGADQPWVHLALADRCLKVGQAAACVAAANAAGQSPQSNLTVRQQAASILLEAKAYGEAMKVLERDISLCKDDSEESFAIATAFAFAAAGAGELDEAKQVVWPRAGSIQRWWELCVDTALVEGVDATEARTWLEHASECENLNNSMRRRLAGAWYRVASRRASDIGGANDAARWALEVIQPILDDKPAKTDEMLAAALHRLNGSRGDAQAAYERVLSEHPGSSVAMNNLAVLLAEEAETLPRSERLAREAVRLNHRPEFVATLSQILAQQGRAGEAISLLEGSIGQLDNNVDLRIHLAELLVDVGQINRARDEFDKLQSSPEDQLTLDQWQSIRDLRGRLD